jgi:solute carrier family 25 thiamine pyrophosphate transporter 19
VREKQRKTRRSFFSHSHLLVSQVQVGLSMGSKKTYPPWQNGIAGAVAGAGARLATAPLDMVRIRRQLDRSVTYPRPSLWSSVVTIVKDEGGVLALFRGSVAATYLWVGYSSVQFAVYGSIRGWMEAHDDPNHPHPTLVAFLSGGSAGVCATLSTYPFDICRTTFAARGPALHSLKEPPGTFQPPKSLYDFSISLYRRKGLSAFYAGSGPASIQIMPYMGLNFAIYDRLTKGDRGVGMSAYAGTISGSVSKIIVYPMDTIKKRIQAQAVFGPYGDTYEGMVDCFLKILRNEGYKSFYRGLVPSVLKTGIAAGLSFSLYRGTKNYLEARHDDWEKDHQQAEKSVFDR